MKTFDQFQEARLTADQRRALPNKDFALPGKGEGPKGKQAGSYPIPDKKHARSALSLVSQHGTPEEKATVRAKVKKKFPDIQQEEVELDERLGGKGYQPYTSLTGKKISGDWEDSDRGAGNKAKKRAGGKVEKKSPTYLAHVHNKEGYESKKTGEVLAAFKRDPKVRKRFEKAAKKEGGPGSAKNRAADDMLQTAKDTAKRKGDTSKSDDRYAYESVGGGVPITPQELEIQKKMSRLNVRLARKRSQEMQKAKIKDTEVAPEQVKEEDKAFNFVVNKLKAKYGSGVMTKGDKMPEPSAAQKKKNDAIRAKRAKEDHRDPTEKASDGRYSDRYSNRGSD